MILDKKIYALLSTLCLSITCSGMHQGPRRHPKHVVLDFGFLVEPNTKAAMAKLGVGGALISGISGKINEADVTKELFDVLYKVKPAADAQENKDDNDGSPRQRAEKLYWHHNPVPVAMVAWFKNNIQSKALLEQAHKVIKKDYSRFTKNRMKSISNMVFDPQQCAEILEPRKEVFQLVTQLQREGHTVHILGNWSSDVRESIQERHSKEFAKINGHVAVSGDLGAIKCLGNTTIYEKFFAAHLPHATAQDIVLVEQAEGKEIWQKSLPIQTPKVPVIVAHPDNTGVLKARLVAAGLLPHPKSPRKH